MTIQKPNEYILNVYKPVNKSSYDIVRIVKRMLPDMKIGHGGTLDPFAEGVLLILIGKATKRMNELLKLRKSYEAILRLGKATASGDNTTETTEIMGIPAINDAMLQNVAMRFTGEIEQTPPAYSAKKINGKPAYKYARKGLSVDLNPVKITIDNLKLQIIDGETIRMSVTCSSGTYIRVLGEEIARALGTCGHLISLKRTRIGDYDYTNAVALNQIKDALSGVLETGVRSL